MQTKVVIIDDNPITVRSLTSTIAWEERGCVVAGTATDGEMGRELVLRVRPDILLLDIQMPQMDGLEMLSQVRAAVPDCKVIIITGYDQFQYASRAIKLSVFDYILKPIRNEEVEEVVDRALEASRSHREQDRAVLGEQRLAAQAKLLSLMMNESRSGQNVHQMLRDSGLYAPCYVVLCAAPQESAQFSQPVLTAVDEALEGRGIRAVTAMLYDALLVYIMLEEEENWRAAVLAADAILREKLGGNVNVGVSRRMFSHHSIRQAYHQARQMLWEQTVSGGSRAAFFSEEEQHAGQDEAFSRMIRSIERLAEHADLSEESVSEAAATLVEIAGRQYSNLRALLSLYAMLLCKKFPSGNLQEVDREIGSGLFCSGEEEVRACLSRLCSAIRRGRQEQEKTEEAGSASLMTRSVLEYIRLHAAESLRLSDVADQFHINANYLSLLIKRQTGVTFHDHLLRAKMDIAHTLLADPRVRVSEVASAVGYSNYISFYNTFKRLEHMTPTEYRNRMVPAAMQEEEPQLPS